MIKINEKGSALVTLLVFSTIALVIVTTGVLITINSTADNVGYYTQSQMYAMLEGGAENAIMQIIRNHNYTGESLSIGGGTVTISVTGTSTKTIQVVATENNHIRRIELTGDLVNNTFNITNRVEY